MKKTVKVENLRDTINDMLQNSTASRDVRRGMMAVLETVLHETGNYRGFRYLTEVEVPDGCLPGITPGDIIINGVVQNNKFPDDSRVRYY